MAGVTLKMGVTGVADFKRGLKDAEAAVNSLNESLKLNESQLKLNGNQELYFSNKVQILKDKIDAQTEVVKAANTELQRLKSKGFSEASAEVQKMQAKVYSATTKLTEMKTELKEVETNGGGAAEGLSKADETMQQMNQNKAWDNVAEGIGKLTKTLERGAKSAVNFGKKIFSSFKDSTEWADDLLSDSLKFDIDPETLQQMQKVAEIINTDVDALIAAKKRMMKAAAGEGADDIMDLFGISVEGKDPTDMMWEIGDALMHMDEAFDKEAAAQKVFGRNWNELVPMFSMGRDAYEKMLAEQSVLTEEQVRSLGDANDKITQLEQQIAQMKNEFWSENADKLTALFQWILDNHEAVKSALVVIAGGFGLLKLAEFAANLQKTIKGFQTLGLLGTGEKAAEAAAGAASSAGAAKTAGGGGNAKWTGFLKDIGFGGVGGLAGLGVDIAGFIWAAYRRNYQRDQVRGTDEYLTAQSAGTEQLLADYIRAQQEISALDWSTTAEVFDAAQQKVTEAYNKLMETEGGADALQAYSDWRQERSLGNMDWEMPENIDKMTRTIDESFATQTQSNSEMTAAANDLKGLPAAVATAVQNGMSSVTIVISESAVGAIGRKVSGALARTVAGAVKP